MKYKMGGRCAFLLSSMFCAIEVFAGFNVLKPVDRLIEEMKRNDADVRSAFCEQLGVFVVGIGRATPANGSPKARDDARVVAQMHAKNAIATFLGSTVETRSKYFSEEVTEDGKTQMRELFAASSESDVKAVLKGVQTYGSSTLGDGAIEFVAYVTSRSQDASEVLRQVQNATFDKGTVRAVGIGAKHDKAEKAALQSAVEQVAGTLMVGKSSLADGEGLKSRLGEAAAGLVDEYRIVGDVKIDGDYKVTIVAKVSKRKIYDSYRSYFKALDNPVFYVQSANSELTESFTQYFIDKGVPITDKVEDANYLIELNGKFIERKNPITGNDGTMLSVSVEVRTVNGSRILMKLPPQKAAKDSDVLTREQRRAAVSQTAFRKIKTRLDEALHAMIVKMLDDAE